MYKSEINKTYQTDSGKAFEYAIAIALFNKINMKTKQRVEIKSNKFFNTTKKCFDKFNINIQRDYDKAAKIAIDHIAKLEPLLENPMADDKMYITIQGDRQGIWGDVRDILVTSSKDKLEIGFSAKNNHNALKHSRLSDKIDFGNDWFDIPCSKQYMNEAKKIFGDLRQIKENKNNDHVLKWSELKDKNTYYCKVLENFNSEINRLYQSSEDIPKLLLNYLIGKFDHYKIMRISNNINIKCFNFNGNLNKSFGGAKPIIKIKPLKLPNRIESTRIQGNKLFIFLEKGWQLSFRIHNASSNIEPSLKFDIQLVGHPQDLYTHNESM